MYIIFSVCLIIFANLVAIILHVPAVVRSFQFIQSTGTSAQTRQRKNGTLPPAHVSGPTAMLAEAAVVGFVVCVAALSTALLTALRNVTPQAIRRLDSLLLCTFSMFLFVAWLFEPLVIYLCGWEGLPTAECQQYLTGRLWLFYAEKFDPIFLALPLWLRIVCSLDTLLFGPFYTLSLYAFATGAQEARWYELTALPVSGALFYSTVVYFAYEVLAESHRASLVWVFVINLPWTLAPLLLFVRLGLLRRGHVVNAPCTSHLDESFFGREPGRYTGSVDAEGRRHGHGEMRYECGDVYVGQFAQDVPSGLGTKTFANGDVYCGQYKDGQEHGHGRFSYVSSGHEYEGGWEAGCYAGLGTMRCHGEVIAAGDWTSWQWTTGGWSMPYPRAGGRGTLVTSRKSTGGPAPRRVVTTAMPPSANASRSARARASPGRRLPAR